MQYMVMRAITTPIGTITLNVTIRAMFPFSGASLGLAFDVHL